MTLKNHGTIQKEIERGEKALKASRLLLEQGLHEDTVSRAYYAKQRTDEAEQFVNRIKEFLKKSGE